MSEPHSFDELLATRLRRPGLVYKLQDSSLALDVIGDSSIDTKAMSVQAVISTPRIDREGDSLNPRGCVLDEYKTNPVVLWEHGFDPVVGKKPIARSDTPDGQLTVKILDSHVEAAAFFSPNEKVSSQFFALIADKIIRATSVRADAPPESREVRRSDDDQPYIWIDLWNLLEWSFGAIGVNPDTLAKVLHIGRLDGQPIEASLIKTLSPLCKTPVWSPGIKEPKQMALTAAIIKGLKTDALRKMMEEEELSEDEQKMAEEEMAAREEEPVEEEPKADTPEEEPPEEEGKPSERFLTAVAMGVSDLKNMVSAGLAQIENPDALEFGAKMLEDLETMEGEVEASFGSVSGGKSLPKADEPKEDEEEAMKSYVAGRGNSPIVSGWSGQLRRIAKGLDTKEAARLENIAKGLDRARAAVRKSREQEDPQSKSLDAISKSLEQLEAKIAEHAPASGA